MFINKSDDFNGFGTGYGSRLRNTNLTATKYSATRNIQKSSMRSRMIQKSASNIDLNLNALSKQLEVRKKNLPAELKNESQFQ